MWKKRKGEFKKLPILLGIALLNAGIPWVLMSYSQQGLDTTISAVLNATGPIFGILFSVLILKTKVFRREILGVLVGFTGIVISFSMGATSDIGFQYTNALLLLIAASIYALSSILITKYLQHVSVFTLSFITMVVGSIFSGFIMLGVQPTSYEGLMDTNNLVPLLMLGVLNSGIGNVIFFYLVKSGGPIFALLITFLMPVTTIFLGVVLLDESIGLGTIIALLFVLTSVYITQKRGGKKHGGFRRDRMEVNQK